MTAPPPGTVERVSATGVAYTARGTGAPVVLIHGWCLNRTLWTVQEEALLHERRVVAVDLAGFGASARLAGPYDLDRHAQDVAALLDELELEDVVVCGFAYGGAVALELAATRPERLARLVVIGIPSGATAPYDKMPRSMRRDWPDFARRSAEAICKQPHSEAKLRWLGDMFGSTPLPVAIETVGVLERLDPVQLSKRVSVPTTFLHGAEDDVVPIGIAEQCADALAGAAQVVPVADAGHLVVVDQPGAVIDAILA